jgi:hypothetical protein
MPEIRIRTSAPICPIRIPNMWYLETCAIFVLVLCELGVGGTQLAAGHGNAEK